MLRGTMLAGFLLSACAPTAAPCPASVPVSSTLPAKTPASEIASRVDSGDLVYSFRASRFSNLIYQIDCLAGTIQCSAEAFRELWQNELGGLSNQDSEQLADWKKLRFEYSGRIQKESSGDDPGLPLPRSRRQIEARVRIAGHTATSEERFAENIRILLDEVDVTRALGIVRHFAPRFDGYWKKNEARTRESAKGFETALKTPGLLPLVGRIAKFYGAELPKGTELVFDLMARPNHDSATHAEQLGERALIEVLRGERPEHRLDVVLHELFHYFLAQARYESLAGLAKSFIGLKHPLAYPAYGLMNEGLATTFGNAMVLRLLDPKKFEERRAKVRGFYDDDFIDALSRSLLEPLDAALRDGRSLFEPVLFTSYMDAIERAFPNGLPPRVFLRPYTAVYEAELEAAYNELDRLVRSPQVASATLDEKEAIPFLEQRPRWTQVILLRPSRVLSKKAWSTPLLAKDQREIERRARANEAFVYLADRDLGRTFVFCASDDARMKELVEKFGKLPTLAAGIQVQMPATQALPAGQALKHAEQ